MKRTKIGTIFPLPKKCYLAFSGGVDSVVLLHILVRRKSDVTLLCIDHLNDFSATEIAFCRETALHYNIPYVIIPIREREAIINGDKMSKECYWSKERNLIFNRMDAPVLTAHNLNDVVESYVMTTFQGLSKIILPSNGNVYRPLLGTTKDKIISYANDMRLLHITDPTNSDPTFCLRNRVRHQLVGNIKECFPGIEKVVKKIVLRKLAQKPIQF